MKILVRSTPTLFRSVTTSFCRSGATCTPLGHDPGAVPGDPAQVGTGMVPGYKRLVPLITLTPRLTRSAKYIVSVTGLLEKMSVLAWLAPVVVQFGIGTCVTNVIPPAGVAAWASYAKPSATAAKTGSDNSKHKHLLVFINFPPLSFLN